MYESTVLWFWYLLSGGYKHLLLLTTHQGNGAVVNGIRNKKLKIKIPIAASKLPRKWCCYQWKHKQNK
jgi:hypothetical protein